jgi:predicted ribosome quality control (RQC) complex YloA/Tae2 family protein
MKTINFEYDYLTYIIHIGSNKYNNFELIDNSNDSDIWFHVEDEPSCHVILKNTDKIRNIPKQVIKRCAYLCKINSKAKTQKRCNIIYTQLENVVKTEIIGQVAVQSYKSVVV